MDLEVAHAIAPDAQMVVVNARPTLEGGRTYERIGEMFDAVDRQFPGAVWSLSIGWGCDALITATDLKPVQSALERAHATRHFGLRRQRRHRRRWNARAATTGRRRPARTTSDSTPSRHCPRMTSVGGTTLSTDDRRPVARRAGLGRLAAVPGHQWRGVEALSAARLAALAVRRAGLG